MSVTLGTCRVCHSRGSAVAPVYRHTAGYRRRQSDDKRHPAVRGVVWDVDVNACFPVVCDIVLPDVKRPIRLDVLLSTCERPVPTLRSQSCVCGVLRHFGKVGEVGRRHGSHHAPIVVEKTHTTRRRTASTAGWDVLDGRHEPSGERKRSGRFSPCADSVGNRR